MVTALDHRLATVPGVARVQAPTYNPAGNAAVLIVYPTTAPQAAPTASLVNHLRAAVVPQATAGTDVTDPRRRGDCSRHRRVRRTSPIDCRW